MKRATTSPSTHPNRMSFVALEVGEQWSGQVTRAIESDDRALLVNLMSDPDSKRRMLEGFAINGAHCKSFAKLCLDFDRIGALRAVVEASPSGITLSHCCTYHHVDARSGLEVSAHQNLHEDAVALTSPEALSLASSSSRGTRARS